jgi:hypothetical protein
VAQRLLAAVLAPGFILCQFKLEADATVVDKVIQ